MKKSSVFSLALILMLTVGCTTTKKHSYKQSSVVPEKVEMSQKVAREEQVSVPKLALGYAFGYVLGAALATALISE